MTSLRTTAEGYLLAIEADSISFDTVSAWVDNLMAEMPDPPPSVIDACCAGEDVNALMANMRQFPGELDLAAACQQMLFHMKNTLAEMPELEPKIVNKLHTFALENGDAAGDHAEFMRGLERELGQADDGAAAELRQKLAALLDTGVAPPAGA